MFEKIMSNAVDQHLIGLFQLIQFKIYFCIGVYLET